MACLTSPGTVREKTIPLSRPATVLTAQSCFQHGTGRTSRSMRFVNTHISPSRVLPLTRQNIQQILQKHAIDIAETYTVDKQRWQQVAADLRQPFWDWARNSVPPAEVISLTQVTITTPDGKRTKVDNPLFHYAFHPIEPSFPDPYINWQTTFRHPTTLDADAKDNVAELKR